MSRHDGSAFDPASHVSDADIFPLEADRILEVVVASTTTETSGVTGAAPSSHPRSSTNDTHVLVHPPSIGPSTFMLAGRFVRLCAQRAFDLGPEPDVAEGKADRLESMAWATGGWGSWS